MMKGIIISLFIVLMLFSLGAFGLQVWDSSKVAYTPENLIRLHVVGNSDHCLDQRYKLKIRDVLLENTEELLADVSDRDDALDILHREKGSLQETVQEALQGWGRKDSVTMELGWKEFPARQYGDSVVPQGEYYALEVLLGEGKGSNWWCVLFPPLCFVELMGGEENTFAEQVHFRSWFWDYFHRESIQ